MNVDYQSYMQSDDWTARAKACKERAGWRCQVCNKPHTEQMLHAHHRTYERLGHEEPGDLIALCTDCHDLFHQRPKETPTTTLFAAALQREGIYPETKRASWGTYEQAKAVIQRLATQNDTKSFNPSLYTAGIRYLSSYLHI